jgi:hypothetical protein
MAQMVLLLLTGTATSSIDAEPVVSDGEAVFDEESHSRGGS